MGAARRFVRDILVTRRVRAHVVDTVELLTSELVTNAVVHARSGPELLVSRRERWVRIEVCDGDASPPRYRTPDIEAASGRGIAIVDELAAETGSGADPRRRQADLVRGAEMSDSTNGQRRVRLLGVPTDLQVRSMRHLDDLLHELHIMQAGTQTAQAATGSRLAALMSEILDAYAAARDSVREQTECARAQGHEVVDIDVDLPPEAAEAAPHLVELLEQADGMCQELELLTMAAPPEVTGLRRWIGDQIVAQVARGEAPAPFRS